MADERLDLNVQNFLSGLEAAEAAATKFIAYMDRVNQVLQRLTQASKAPIEVAQALAAIGGASEFAASQMQALKEGSAEVSAVAMSLGAAEEAIKASVMAAIAGNAQYEQSVAQVGLSFDLSKLKLIEFQNAFKKYQGILAGVKAETASTLRSAELPRSAARTRDIQAYESTDPRDYESPTEIAYARAIQRIQRTAARAGLKADIPSPEMGDDKVRLNMARLSMAYDNLRQKIAALNTERRAYHENDLWDEGHYRRMQIALNAAIAAREKEHAQQVKLQQFMQQQRLAAMKVNVDRELDAMYVKMPAATARRYVGSARWWHAFVPDTLIWSKFGQGATKAFAQVNAGIQIVTKGTLGFARAIVGAGSQMAFMTASISGLFAMVTGATMGTAFKMALDFENAMRRINILVKQGESDLPTLTAQVKELSKAFGFDPMKMSEGFRIAISSDVDPAEAKAFMTEAAKLAVTQSSSIEKTADMLAMMKNAFNLSTGSLGRLRDMIFVMTDRGRVEVEQFAGEIGKISSVAALAGVNVKEMLGAFAALSRTKGPEQAGTMLINLFKLIAEQGPKSQQVLRELGIFLSPAQTRGFGLLEQITKIHDGLAKNPQLIEQMTEDFRELRAWGELTGSQFEALKSIFSDLDERVGVADEKEKEMIETSEKRWQRLTAQLKVSAIEMGASIMETFNNWIDSSGGVEKAQMKLEKGIKRIELAFRLFLIPFQIAAGAIVETLTVIYDIVATIWNAMQLMWSGAKTIYNQSMGWFAKAMYEYTGNEKWAKTREGYGAAQQDSFIQNRKKWGELLGRWSNVATNFDALGTGSNIESIAKLSQEIADLDSVTSQAEEDAAALAAFTKRYGAAAAQAALDLAKQKKAEEELNARGDPAKAIREMFVKVLIEQVKDGSKALKNWLTDNQDTVKGIIAGYRKLASESEATAKALSKDLKDLQKDRHELLKDFNNDIEAIKDKDRTPAEIVRRLKEAGEQLERDANLAAKAGDRELVQKYVKEAADKYKAILGIADTKENRATVVANLERLRDQLDKLYQLQGAALEAQVARAEAAAQAFTAQANNVELHFKAFAQGVTDVGRELDKLGSAPPEEKLKKLKDRLLELQASTQFFINIQDDPALGTLDKMIERARELSSIMGAVPDELLKKLKDPELRDFIRAGTIPVTPVEPKSTTNNTNNVTNVDMRGTQINAGSEGGPKKADARRLARDIKRHIERGEAPALSRR